MIKKIIIFIFLTIFTTAAFTQTKPRLAILPITGGTDGDGETIAELFSFEAEINRVFVPIPRTSSIESIMREQQFQRSTGLTDSDTIARLGRQYNADYVVAGHIQVLGNSKLIIITIIHVESLQQIAGDYREYRNIEEIQGMISDMARRIARASQINRTNLPRLAVLPFAVQVSGVNQSDAEVLAQLLAAEIANSGKYAVLPRTSQIQVVMTEHEIQRSGITEGNSIRAIGQALNAQYVLAGNVRRLGQTNMFTVQILEVESASLITGSAENYSTIADGLTMMASLSQRLTGASAVTPNTPSSAAPQNFGNIISLTAGWRTEAAGGNAAVTNGTTAEMNTGREVIQGVERDVMTLTVNLARGNAWRLGQFIFENDAALQRIRTAAGIRFKVLGDGRAGWKITVPTIETLSDGAFFEAAFSPGSGRVVSVDIPFSRLRQPSWGRRESFNRNNIVSIQIQRYAGDNETMSGTSVIKIFDFEFY